MLKLSIITDFWANDAILCQQFLSRYRSVFIKPITKKKPRGDRGLIIISLTHAQALRSDHRARCSF